MKREKKAKEANPKEHEEEHKIKMQVVKVVVTEKNESVN